MTKVKLYGHLGKAFGREFEFELDTVNEAIRALSVNLAGFQAYLIEHSEPGYRVLVDDRPVMDLEEFGLSAQSARVIKIVPSVVGAGDGKAIGQIIFGVVLVAAAFFTYGQSLWGFSASTVSNVALSAGVMGASMIVGGITNLMSAVPDTGNNAKQSTNYGFGNGQDTIEQGLRIPICYGRMLCTGLPISVRIVVEND